MLSNEFLFFGCFLAFIFSMLAIDLGLFAKKNEPVKLKQAAIMSAIWVTFALLFFVLIRNYGYMLHGVDSIEKLTTLVSTNRHAVSVNPQDFAGSLDLYNKALSLEFITGYVVEYALSVDNIFVIVLIFSAFGVDPRHYHRVLFWGILGAVVMRFTFIFLGASLISRFEWILYIFGAFLVYTGISMFFSGDDDEKIDTENHKVVRFAAKYFAIHTQFEGNKFFIKQAQKRLVTPLFVVLLVVEFTDLVFAVDSIPAIFAITKDPYIVFFSNIFAILGLRSMFFLLMNVIHKFHYLKPGLAIILSFIGVKMLTEKWLHEWGFTTVHSLYVIIAILFISVVLSLVFPKKHTSK